MFRSADMSMAQLYISNEIGRECVNALGELGLVQFRDVCLVISNFLTYLLLTTYLTYHLHLLATTLTNNISFIITAQQGNKRFSTYLHSRNPTPR